MLSTACSCKMPVPGALEHQSQAGLQIDVATKSKGQVQALASSKASALTVAGQLTNGLDGTHV